MHAVFFDVDGTLFDTRADLAATVNHTRRDLGFPELPVDENIALACSADPGEKTAAEHGLDPGRKASELSSVDRVKLLFLQRYLQKPAYITAEEPFRGMDDPGREQALRFIEEQTEKTGIPVLIIETEKTGDLS